MQLWSIMWQQTNAEQVSRAEELLFCSTSAQTCRVSLPSSCSKKKKSPNSVCKPWDCASLWTAKKNIGHRGKKLWQGCLTRLASISLQKATAQPWTAHYPSGKYPSWDCFPMDFFLSFLVHRNKKNTKRSLGLFKNSVLKQTFWKPYRSKSYQKDN